ncbi:MULTISPECIES: hypothetical protein [unclassified Marinovum]
MTRDERTYTAAATLMFLSAGLHLPIAALSPAAYGGASIIAAVLWALLGLGLLRAWRWCAYPALLAMMFELSFALGGAMETFGAMAGLFWALVAVNLVAAAVLFPLLWARKATDPETAQA